MKAVVVYESLWGNTKAIAEAITAGIGPEAQALNTSEASRMAISDADLIVAGAPVQGFSLPTDGMRRNIAASPKYASSAPDLSHPIMRQWLAALPPGRGWSAVFETRLWWSLGGATAAILKGLARAGYNPLAKATKERRFIVKGAYGPLREGELERARLWGVELAQVMHSRQS